MEQTLQEFLGVDRPARSKKPRAESITLMTDTGWPSNFCEKKLIEGDTTRRSEKVVNEEIVGWVERSATHQQWVATVYS